MYIAVGEGGVAIRTLIKSH